MRARRAAVVAAVLASVVAGCAGDDDAGSAGSGESSTDSTESTATESTVTESTVTESAATRAPATATSSSDSPTTSSTSTPPPTTEPAEPAVTIEPVSISEFPATANGPANAATVDLAAAGYVEREYLFEGDAVAYEAMGDLPADGTWDVVEGAAAPYVSRLLVRRPVDSADFSGVVLVEWFNVSGGQDADPDWGYTSAEILREGHVWVGVSAQQTGVSGGTSRVGQESVGLVGTDPERYGGLVHPGDAHAFDIYTQAGRALVAPDGADPLGGLEPVTIIAVGESQSAAYLSTYANAVQPRVGFYEGFLLHGRGSTVAAVDATDRVGPTLLRTDLDVPTLVFDTETDLTVLGYVAARQDDSDTVRAWEVAGTAHADSFLLEEVYGGAASAALVDACGGPINDGPQAQTLRAALHHLVAWVVDGTPPPTSPRLATVEDPDSEFGFAIQRDELGNAVGGIRTPAVDVPVSTLSGDPIPGGAGFCNLFGSEAAFDAARLDELYGDPATYRERVDASLDDAVAAGWLLAPEADAWRAEAAELSW